MLPGSAAADGVYIRAGAGLDRSNEARFTDADCSTHALYGCDTGTDGAPHSAVGDFGAIAGVEAGVGYRVAPALRIEGVVQSRPRTTFEGRANFLAPERRQSISANLSSLSVLATAYVDLPGLGLLHLGPFRPFVGAGAGASRIDTRETTMAFPVTMTLVPAGRRTSLAWMVAAGAAAPLGGGLTLDVAWRYLASSRAKTACRSPAACSSMIGRAHVLQTVARTSSSSERRRRISRAMGYSSRCATRSEASRRSLSAAPHVEDRTHRTETPSVNPSRACDGQRLGP